MSSLSYEGALATGLAVFLAQFVKSWIAQTKERTRNRNADHGTGPGKCVASRLDGRGPLGK